VVPRRRRRRPLPRGRPPARPPDEPGLPGYNEADTIAKIRQHELRKDAAPAGARGPTSCAKLAEVSTIGDEGCVGCPFAGRVHGPIGAAKYKDPAPPPQVMELLSGIAEPVVVTIPDPPAPFVRLKGGGIAVYAEDADGNKDYNTIYEHDLFPIRRLSNLAQGLEQQVWHADLPRGESKDFTLDADMLYDTRKFVTAIANQGVYPHKGNIPGLQEYMVAYIAQLQKLVDADAQHNHLGWTDDFTRFIFPDKILAATAPPSPRSSASARSARRPTCARRRHQQAGRAAALLRAPGLPRSPVRRPRRAGGADLLRHRPPRSDRQCLR
jgi:hypothetical protein